MRIRAENKKKLSAEKFVSNSRKIVGKHGTLISFKVPLLHRLNYIAQIWNKGNNCSAKVPVSVFGELFVEKQIQIKTRFAPKLWRLLFISQHRSKNRCWSFVCLSSGSSTHGHIEKKNVDTECPRVSNQAAARSLKSCLCKVWERR